MKVLSFSKKKKQFYKESIKLCYTCYIIPKVQAALVLYGFIPKGLKVFNL